MNGVFHPFRWHNLCFRVIHRARAQRIGLAKNHHLVANAEVFLHKRQVPPPAVQTPGAILQNELINRPDPFAVAIEAGSHNCSAGQRGLFQLQFGNALKMPAILVAPRPVQQEVAHRAQFQPFQLRRAFRPDAA
jgi:hypothetical protein